jgi:nucleotide-binding universal stress UspA family protein
MLLGSITAKVLHDVTCPVLTIAHAENTPAVIPPFRAILCAVDFGPQSEAVLRWADGFACMVGGQVHLIHMLPVIPMGQWGYCDSNLSQRIREDAEQRAYLLVKQTGTQAKILLETGTVAEGLRDLAKSISADVLVIGRHHEGGHLGRLRDTAYAIIRESPCPVISV